MTELLATAATDLQHTLKGVQGGDQEKGTLCSEKTGRTGLQAVRYFQEKFLMNLDFCIFPYLEKH